jgi:hypothetical protein
MPQFHPDRPLSPVSSGLVVADLSSTGPAGTEDPAS